MTLGLILNLSGLNGLILVNSQTSAQCPVPSLWSAQKIFAVIITQHRDLDFQGQASTRKSAILRSCQARAVGGPGSGCVNRVCPRSQFWAGEATLTGTPSVRRRGQALQGPAPPRPEATPPELPLPSQEHPPDADDAHHRPDQRLCQPLGPARGLPGARGGPDLHLPPAPRRPPDPPDLALGDQVPTTGKEVRPGRPGGVAGKQP